MAENAVEGFILETNGHIPDDILLNALRSYYHDAEVVVRGDFHWVKRSGHEALLLDITNLSDSRDGARHFGGTPGSGAIGINITRHAEAT